MTPEEITALESLVRQARAEQVDGSHLLPTSYRDNSPVVAPAPIQARPIGAYVALGIGGAVGISALAMAAAVLAVAVSIGAVSMTICVLVLRQMWERYAAERGEE